MLHVTRPPSESEFCCTCFVATSPKTACHVPKSVTPLHDIVESGKVPGHTGWMSASFHLPFAAKPGHQKGGDTIQRVWEVLPKYCYCREHDCILKVSLATIGGCAALSSLQTLVIRSPCAIRQWLLCLMFNRFWSLTSHLSLRENVSCIKPKCN